MDEEERRSLVERAKQGDPFALASLVEQAKEERAKAGQTKRGHPLTFDTLAFEELYYLYSGKIQRYLRYILFLNRLADDIAQDLTQDTFCKAWLNLSKLRKGESFGCWIYKIAMNNANDYLKKVNEESDMLVHVQRLGEMGNSKEWTVLMLALSQVTPKYRECILLYDIEGFTQSEIAQVLGIGQRQVSRYLERGYKELRQAYQRLKGLDNLFL